MLAHMLLQFDWLVTAKLVAPSRMGRVHSANPSSGICLLEQKGASLLQSPIQRALQNQRAIQPPWTPRVSGTAAFMATNRARIWLVHPGMAAWACTSEALMESSQNFPCRKKGRLPRQQDPPSIPSPAHIKAPSESRLVEQQHFLSSSETPGGSWTGGTHNVRGYPACYQPWPCSAGRKRVSIPAEPCFRWELFLLSRGGLGCAMLSTLGLVEQGCDCYGERRNHEFVTLYPHGIARVLPHLQAMQLLLPQLCPGLGMPNIENLGMGRGQSW